jgi:hypothetical protein
METKDGFYWPDLVYRSDRFVEFIKQKSFRMWFRLATNIIRSGDMRDPVSKPLYPFYQKDLLVSYFPERILAGRLGVTDRCIKMFKKELVDGGWVKTKSFHWHGRKLECFVMGTIKDGKEILYAFEKCVPGYRFMERKWFFVWPRELCILPRFDEFLSEPSSKLWFFMAANILRGNLESPLARLIKKKFFEEELLLPAYYPDKMFAAKLGVSVRSIKAWKRQLIDMGLIETKTFSYKKHKRSVCILGRYEKIDLDNRKEYFVLFDKLMLEHRVKVLEKRYGINPLEILEDKGYSLAVRI